MKTLVLSIPRRKGIQPIHANLVEADKHKIGTFDKTNKTLTLFKADCEKRGIKVKMI